MVGKSGKGRKDLRFEISDFRRRYGGRMKEIGKTDYQEAGHQGK
jgi:hypothetical protein